MLTLERSYVDQMIAHAREENPNECCGIIAGDDGRAANFYRITNAAKSPFRYRMDPQEFFRAYRDVEDRGWRILVLYHSHTHTEARPSDTDIRLATGPDGRSLWPDTYYVLVSLANENDPSVRAFTIEDGVVQEHELRVI